MTTTWGEEKELDMSDRPILVTGAAGGPQGSTGNWISRFLLERGLRVRAFVHRIDQRSNELAALGAEVVQGDCSTSPRCGAPRPACAGLLCLPCPGGLA